MTKEYKRQRKGGVRRSLLYVMRRERGKPPKITFRLVDILLTEYETGTLTIRKNCKQLSPFEEPADPELVKKFLSFYGLEHLLPFFTQPACCLHPENDKVISLPSNLFLSNCSHYLAFATKIMHIFFGFIR